MWLSKKQNAQAADYAEEGTLTISSSALTEAMATMQSRNAASFSPYGYSYSAPVGESVLLLNTSGGTCCAGIKMAEKSIEQGEIEIESLGGAKIRLYNDGRISLNGLIISADGRILNNGGNDE